MSWFQLVDKYAEADLTIGNLLSMNSGFGRSPDLAAYVGAYNSSRTLIEALARCEPDVPLRKMQMYSNTNYEILGVLIEEISGKSWDIFLNDRLFKPLGMTHKFASIYDVPASLSNSLSAGHFVCKDQVYGPITLDSKLNSLSPTTPRYAAVSIVSNAADMASFLRLVLNKGKVGNTTIFKSPATIAAMITGENVAGLGPPDEESGLYYAPDAIVGHAYVEKGGDTPLHHAVTGYVPHTGLGIGIMGNSNGRAQLYQTRAYVLGIFLDVPKDILDYSFKKWRNATDADADANPLCGYPYSIDPPRLPLTPAERDALVGEYTPVKSPGYFPKMTISRGLNDSEFVFGLQKATMVYTTNDGPDKVFLAVGTFPGTSAFAFVSSDGAATPTFVVNVINIHYSKQPTSTPHG